VLAKVRMVLSAPVIDLCDADVRYEVDRTHRTLLNAHGMEHLDLSEVTAKRRPVTQTIAAYAYDHWTRRACGFPQAWTATSVLRFSRAEVRWRLSANLSH
jgi:hypothetical protein